jgi:hypothetical protein
MAEDVDESAFTKCWRSTGLQGFAISNEYRGGFFCGGSKRRGVFCYSSCSISFVETIHFRHTDLRLTILTKSLTKTKTKTRSAIRFQTGTNGTSFGFSGFFFFEVDAPGMVGARDTLSMASCHEKILAFNRLG